MKKLFALILSAAGLMLVNHAAVAQEARVQITEDGQRVPEARQSITQEFRTSGAPETTGIISLTAKGGLEVVSPVASEYYGDGRDYVAQEEETGKPKGFILFRLSW